MANALYLYFPIPVTELEKSVASFQEEFDEFLQETFSEEELAGYEALIDRIGAVFVQPIFSELTFDDFYFKEELEASQRSYFDSCRSCICLENLPDFHSNPFQVSWLLQLLGSFTEVLIDQGGVEELTYKEAFMSELKKYRSIDTLIASPLERPIEVKTTQPIYPIDFLILDVYKELDRLRAVHKIYFAMEQVESLSEKCQKIFKVMMQEKIGADALLRKTGLNAKDFDDNLERLKFFLRKL